MKNAHHHPHHHAPPQGHADLPTEGTASDPDAIRVDLEARETEWEIRPGQTVAGYGYNGQVPGPVIEAKQGVPLEIRFTNRLPEATLIHWHGLRVPAPMDGTQGVQRPVEPGETLSYTWNHRHADAAYDLESVVTFTLTPIASGTLLRMEQAGFRPDQKQALGGAKHGWKQFFGKLEQLLESVD